MAFCRIVNLLFLLTSCQKAFATIDTKLRSRGDFRQQLSAQKSDERNLQEEDRVNIFLIFRGGSESEDEIPAPTAAPTLKPKERSTSYRECDDENPGPVGVALLGFVYNIEFNVETLPEGAEEYILEYLATQMVDSIFASKCAARRLVGEDTPSSRQLRIESISGGRADKLQGICKASVEESRSCNSYDGTMAVGFNHVGEDSSHEKVGNSIIQKVTDDMADSSYLLALNLALTGMGVRVTKLEFVRMSFVDPLGSSAGASGLQSFEYKQEEGGLTKMGKTVVPVLALLFIGVLVAGFLGYRARYGDKRELATLVEDCDLYLEPDEDKKYFDADVMDLGKNSSMMNVHKCNKTNCHACSIQPTLFSMEDAETATNDVGEDGITEEEAEDDGYTRSVETRILDPESFQASEPAETDGIFVTKPAKSNFLDFFGIRGRAIKAPRLVEVMEEAEQESAQQGSLRDIWEDEPDKTQFLKVDGSESQGVDNLGIRRVVTDHSGYVRNEIEL